MSCLNGPLQLRAIAGWVFWAEAGVLIGAWMVAYVAHQAFIPFSSTVPIGLATGVSLGASAALAVSGPWEFLATLDAQFPEAAAWQPTIHNKTLRVVGIGAFAFLLGFWAGALAIPELWTIAFGTRGEHMLHVARYEPAWRTVCEHVNFQEGSKWASSQDLCLGPGHHAVPSRGAAVLTTGRASALGVTIERYAFLPPGQGKN